MGLGTAIGDIVPRQKISLESLNAKTLGVDSYNIIYQFLSSIRGEDGNPLKDSHGNLTSHLAGLFYRSVSLCENGVRLVFVFDGKPSALKSETLKKRHEIRTEAFEMHKKAIAEGNLEDAKKFGSRALKLDEKMVNDAKELISAMGFPCIQAPSEGEAQASFMAKMGKIDGVVSQDYDSLLFGCPTLYRNVAVTGKRKVPGRNIWADISPEKILLEQVLNDNNISREKLIWIGILVGTDFNEKFPKIGIKTALKLAKSSNSFEEIISKTGFQPDFDYRVIEEIFLNPEVDTSFTISFSKPDREKIVNFLCDKHDFSFERVQKSLDRLESNFSENAKQSTLGRWF